MRVSTKGQVTIPLHLREEVGIVPGSEVEFQQDGQRLYLRKVAAPGRGQALVKQMAGKGTVKMTTDEILALTRGET
ncbi:MAG TPA: AbrB/MazE/SpoVT family DNA-binding domain-containing protein [Candidatus Hydrogenedentes bacterium]|nr:AbrB/MazE/SpoVT family DNA-binding domain-containing protein [Candidatus Hydrogenedentota bacterium]HPG69923.1 AbrB/MazE/SpoVT family DNA-binding domain-containing protein [Candidatus Hydrogenedentota bacterium]